MTKVKSTEEMRNSIVELYRQGSNANEIAKKFGYSSSGPVFKILYSAGIEPNGTTKKSSILFRNRLKLEDITVEQGQQIVNKYIDGLSYLQISKEYGYSNYVIRSYLINSNVPTRKYPLPNGGLNEKEIKELLYLWKTGVSVGTLVKKFHRAYRRVGEILKENGEEVISYGNSKSLSFLESQKAEILNLWDEGKSQITIGKILNLSQATIGRFLRLNCPTFKTKQAKGERHGRWNGGKHKRGGYDSSWLPDDHKFNLMRNRMGYVLDHRLIMAEKLGRPLTKTETVHHINGITDDNRIDNLELRQGKHGKNVAYRCRSCGSIDVEPVGLK